MIDVFNKSFKEATAIRNNVQFAAHHLATEDGCALTIRTSNELMERASVTMKNLYDSAIAAKALVRKKMAEQMLACYSIACNAIRHPFDIDIRYALSYRRDKKNNKPMSTNRHAV